MQKSATHSQKESVEPTLKDLGISLKEWGFSASSNPVLTGKILCLRAMDMSKDEQRVLLTENQLIARLGTTRPTLIRRVRAGLLIADAVTPAGVRLYDATRLPELAALLSQTLAHPVVVA